MTNTPEIPDNRATVYTDGACIGNPGPGGWGAVLIRDTNTTKIYGSDSITTNNRMELMAPIRALETLTQPATVVLYTDSTYVLNGITKWLPRWKVKGWRTSGKAPVKNVDLWKRLEAAAHRHTVQWVWVKGHSGVAGNDLADQLACRGAREASAGFVPPTGGREPRQSYPPDQLAVAEQRELAFD